MKRLILLVLFFKTSYLYAQSNFRVDVFRLKNGIRDTLKNQAIIFPIRNIPKLKSITCPYGTLKVISDVFYVNRTYFFLCRDKSNKAVNGEIQVNDNYEIYLSYDATNSIQFKLKPKK